MTFRRTIGAGAILCALLIAGCATAEIPTAEPEPAPESTPVAPEPTEEPAPEEAIPTSLFELGCEEAVPIDRVIELYGTEMVALDTQPIGISSALLMTSAALADGALSCHWAPPGEEFATMTLTASVATAEEYAVGYEGYDRFPRPTEPLPLLDGARAECSEYFPFGSLVVECGWSVYSDGVWIVAQFDNLPADEVLEPDERVNPDTSSNGPTANPDGDAARILINAAMALAQSSLSAPPSVESGVSCDDIAANAEVPPEWGAVSSVVNNGILRPEVVGSTTEWSGGPLTALAMERQGWANCLLAFDSWLTVTVTVAPSAAWILDVEPYPGQEWLELDDGDGASWSFSDEGGSYSSVAIARGDDLFAVNTRYHTTDADITEELARSLAARLGL